MLNSTTGGANTALGRSALRNLTTGDANVAVGICAGSDASMINITTESNRFIAGHNNITNAYVKVDWTVTSDLRDKTEIKEVPHGLEFVDKLKPVSFRFKKSRENPKPHGMTKYGFLAQDILELEGSNNVIIDNENNESLKVTNSHLIPVLVKAIQDLKKEIDLLKEDNKKK